MLTPRPPNVRLWAWKLACDDKAERHECFAAVRASLGPGCAAAPLPYLDMMVLWKGLYYLLWKEDDKRAQAAISQRACRLIRDLPGACGGEDSGGQAVLFARCGLETLCREWPKVDYLRTDKVLYLMRRLVYEILLRAVHGGDLGPESDDLISTTFMVMLNPGRIASQAAPRALALHLADVWMEAVSFAIRHLLDSTGTDGGDAKPSPDLVTYLLLPWVEQLARGTNAWMDRHVADSVFYETTDYAVPPPLNMGDYLQSSAVGEPGASPPEPSTLVDHVWFLAAQPDCKAKEALESFANDLENYVEWWDQTGRAAFEAPSGEEDAPRPAGRKADIEVQRLRDEVNAYTYTQFRAAPENLEMGDDKILRYTPRLQQKTERNELYAHGIRKTVAQEGVAKYEKLAARRGKEQSRGPPRRPAGERKQ